MPSSEEDKIFDGKAIRDNANHNSGEALSGVYKAKTIFIENGLNQTVTLQLQGARNSVWVNVGASCDVPANSNSYKTVNDYFPKYRMQASCGTSPTNGALDVWIIKAA